VVFILQKKELCFKKKYSCVELFAFNFKSYSIGPTPRRYASDARLDYFFYNAREKTGVGESL
jgi:hypothetical protein